MFQIFMMLLGFGGGVLYVLQGFQLVPLKINPNEAQEKFKSRPNQRKFAGLILIFIGLVYIYELAAAI